MANMISELINHELGYKTTLVSNLGSTNVVHQALIRNDADIAATRYTGTDLTGTLNLSAEKDHTKAAKIVKNALTKLGSQVMALLIPMLSWSPASLLNKIISRLFPIYKRYQQQLKPVLIALG